MKTLRLPAAVAALLFCSFLILPKGSLLGQCGTDPPLQPDTSHQRGGVLLPTWNPLVTNVPVTVNCVIVFVDFPDDNTDSGNMVWPLEFDPSKHPYQATAGWSPTHRPPHPAMMADIIDPSVANPGPTGKKWNITTYFRDMSYGKFNLIGHVVYQQARYPFSDTTMRPDGITYSTTDSLKGRTRRSVVQNVIEDLKLRIAAGQLSNVFEGMDSWNMIGGQGRNFVPGNDQSIELVIFCFRNDRLNHSQWSGWSGIADLDLAASIKVNDGTPDQAYVFHGVTAQNMKAYPEGMSVDIIWHEIGHLLGLSHQYWDGMWSPMTHRAEGSFMMNSWERWKLGWMEFFDYAPTVSMAGNGDTVTICDLATHPQAIRIRLPDTTSEQYFFVEHHRQFGSNYITSLPSSSHPWYNPNDRMTYDIVDDSVQTPGMYILYLDGRSYVIPPRSHPNDYDQGGFRVMCADGRWHWVTDGWVTAPWSTTQQLRLYRRGMAARSAGGPNPDSTLYEGWNTYKTDRQTLDLGINVPKPGNPNDSIHLFDHIWAWKGNAGPGDDVYHLDTVNVGRIRSFGDGGDAWTLQWNTIFSPWSNPNTSNRDGEPTNIAVQLLAQNDTLSTVKIWLSGSLNAPPSKPQNLLVHLQWNPQNSVYHPVLTWETNVEPDVDSVGVYEIQRCESGCDQENNWTSQDTVMGNVSLWIDTLSVDLIHYSHRYRIRAKDSQNYHSVWSEKFHLYGGGDAKHEDDPPATKSTVYGSALLQGVSAQIIVEPNPVSTEGSIIWNIPEAGGVSIRIFDLSGRQIAWPVNGFVNAGTHSVAFNNERLPSGSYICLLQYKGRAWNTLIVVK